MSETKEDLYVPSRHLYMDWETALRRIVAIFRSIAEEGGEYSEDINTMITLAHLGWDIAEDQLAVNERQRAFDDAQEKNTATPAVLRAQTFELLDGAGKVRARITCNKNNEVIIQDLYANEILRTPMTAKKETTLHD